MHTLTLRGCSPIPLAHYLKALGILRLVSEQKDSSATGRWHRDQFVLSSSLDRDALARFFLEEYEPTSVMAPWNGGSGFHPKDNSKALSSIQKSSAFRLVKYAEAISAAQDVLRSMNLGEKPTPDQKADLLLLCRNVLPDSALQWLDAAYVLTDDGAKYPPLLGTGGNDGRLEFTNNFMQRVLEVVDAETGKPEPASAQQLISALFAEPVATLLSKAPVGQFLPGSAGGVNATSGFDAASAVNPWDFILMMEGALLFASASVKRMESGDSGALAYPFCVRQSGVGYASASSADESASRAEMWMPLWTKQAVTLAELSSIFSEGRAQVGGRAARNGVDFARAIVGLGVDRGLDEFQRFGFQVRNGLSYFATPLTRIVARKNESADLLSDIDAWLDRFRRAATKDTAPATALRALRVLESRIIDLCVTHTPERLMRVFVALGHCEATVARSFKWAQENYLHPLHSLRKEWLVDNWNNGKYGTEFRLAASLASLTGQFGKDYLPLRCHLEQVDSYISKDKSLAYRWADVTTNNVQWSQAPLPDVLNNVFARRLILNEDLPRTRSELWASLADIKAFIEGQTDDSLLSELIWSMSLINWRDQLKMPERSHEWVVPPTFYALLKSCYPPAMRDLPEGILKVPSVPAIHRHAAQGAGAQAATLAIRRLRGSSYHPLLKQMPVQGDHARRSAAALLFPISFSAQEALIQQITRPAKESESVAA
jgi:CRISPR-associated protein Csx17